MPHPRIAQSGLSRLARVPLAPVLGQESEADVDIGQCVPLDQPAQAERQRIATTLDQEKSKPVIGIQPLRTSAM